MHDVLVWLPALPGILLALFLPRWRTASLTLFGALTATLALGIYASTRENAMIGPVIALMAGGFLLCALLARLLPRLLLLLFIPLATLLALGPALLLSAWPKMMAAIALGTFALVLTIFGVIFRGLGVRILWALPGAALAAGLHGLTHPPLLLLLFFGLLLANWLTGRPGTEAPPLWGTVLRGGFLGGLLWGGLLFTVLLLIPELPPAGNCLSESAPPSAASAPLTAQASAPAPNPAPPSPAACRQQALQQKFPAGGIVWPLPSEAITWGTAAWKEFPRVDNLDALYLGLATQAPAKIAATDPLRGAWSLNGVIEKSRLNKEAGEIAKLTTAQTAISTALRDNLKMLRTGESEGALAAAIHNRQIAHGCDGDSFPPIVASGEHALDFHYMANDGKFAEGDLVVIDIGCYANHYASDFTRTLPVGGKFSPHQRELYTAVYDAQQAAAKACKPGVFMYDESRPRVRGLFGKLFHSEKPLVQNRGKTLSSIARETLTAHKVDSEFGHGIGHPLGLFVHDVFDRKAPLAPGMVIMIEPGLYLPKEKTGIRLEDAFLVTETGCVPLETGFPADPDSIERLMAEAK